MMTIFAPTRTRPLGILAGICLSAFGHTAIAETSLVQDFDSQNWLSDDTRNNLGDNLIGAPQISPSSGITNSPAEADPAGSSVNLYDASAAIRSQIYWSDAFYGTKGNLGGVFLNTTAALTPNRMKSTISIVDSAAGLGAVADVLGSNFEASYRWFVDPTADPTKVALKFGIQSSQWAQSQTGFDSQRSGESAWDLLLVYIPEGTPTANSVFTSSLTSTSTKGQWSVYRQAANGYFGAETLIKDFGSASLQQVLQDPLVVSGSTLGSLLSGGKVASVQLGVGSGTSDQNFVGGVDWAQVSFLNGGETFDFVDASVWTGTNSQNFATAGNWTVNTVNNEQGPSPTNNVIFNATPASPVLVSSDTQARSVSAANGDVTINIGANHLELLNDGFLSAQEGAELHLTGSEGGLVSAAALEAWGRVSLATEAKFDGGSVNQPGRNGRYGIVVAEGGTLDLEDGADVLVVNESGMQGVKTLIRVGEDTPAGGTGVMNIKPGSHLTGGSLFGTGSWTGFHVGDWGGTGEVNQTGGTVDLFGAIVIGNEGGSGVYTISGADSLVNIRRPIDDNGAIIIGRATANRTANGVLNIEDGLVVIGASGGASGSVSLVLGGLSDDLAAYANANGTINQTGGELRFDSGSLIFGRGHGVYNLNGGVLSVGGTNGISATPNGVYEMNLGGGTLRVRGTALTTSVSMNLSAGSGGLIDTNNLGATFSGNIAGANGVFVKTGLGNLTLSGTSRTVGYLNSDLGTITQTSGDTTVTEFVVGGNFIAHDGAYVLDGGTITVGGTSLVAPIASFRVGDFGGTGVFTQNAGAVTVGGAGDTVALNIGNQGGSGTYNLNGGTLTLAGGNNVIGRSSDSYPASTGVLNISGGLLDITNNSALINGNNFNVANLGTGTINQTGGTLRVSDGALYIAGYGDGTYNLRGGILEIGGNDLIARYNNTSSVSAFNLGGSTNGATVRTIGSALNTSVDWNLVDGTANKEKGTKLDTNNLGATLSGNIAGAGGGLVKTGLGTLTLSGATRNIGYFNADEGSSIQSAGVTTATEFVVGSNYSAKNGTFTLNGGSIVMSGSTPDAPTPSLRIGDWGGTGTFTQNAGTVTVGGAGIAAALNIGNQGGSGIYNLNGGTLTLAGGLNILGRSSGANPASTGVLNITGGLLDITNNSSLINGNNFNVANLGTGTINQSGGILRVSDGALYIAGFGNGIYNLSGGTLEIGGNDLVARYNNTASVSTFNLGGSANGATVKAIGTALNTSVDWNLVTGTANKERGTKINTNGLGATMSGNIYGAAGGIVKTGSGELTLSGATRNAGYFNTDEGTTVQSSGMTTSAEFVVGSNYSAKNGEFILNGGSIVLSGSTTDAPTPSLRVGDWGGTGVMTQNAGTVTVGGVGISAALNIGNQGGSGTYNLNGGTLTLAGGLNILGRSSGTNPSSTGVLNISGGLLDITNNSSLINGNNFNVANLGTGTINQSGGTLRVSDGALYIAGFGNGTYNLSGGTLEIGGNDLVARYNNTTAISTFNLGGSANGATVKAIGSALNTAVDWNLVAGTANKEKGTKINTNGLGATLSGNIAGADGGIVKTGTGNLTLSGTTRNVGYFNVDEGTTTQSAGTTTSSEFVVGSNYSAKNGEFILNGGTVAISGTTSDSPVPTLRVGDFGGTGVFTQNSGAVNIGLLGEAALNIGNQGGSGTYNLNGGTLTLAGGNSVLGRSSGSNPASTGVLNISGGLLDIANGSALINGNNFNVVNLGTGTINQTGGTLRVSDGSLYIAGFGNGTYNLSGGTLEVGGNSLLARYNNTTALSTFNLGGSANGATVKAIGSALNTSVDWNLVSGTSNKEKATKINTNNLGATLSGNISGVDGGIVKAGGGNLTLSGATRDVGYFNVDEGTTTQSSGTTTTSEFVVGGNYSEKNGEFILNGGTVAVSGTTSDSPVPTLRVGDFGGTGVFTQNDGAVNVGLTGDAALNIGNQGGSGTYNLNGGTLTLAGGNNVLGRSTGVNPAGTGVLNIAGGLLEITNGSALINGNNANVANLGTGTITQTGGTLRVSDGALYVSGFGNGTYNLNAGTLEVGGSGLVARYNNITSLSAFHLGGGTVKVIGTKLTSDASPLLMPSTTSTIDTNGLGVHFTKGIQGSGTLRKTGAGDLEITGASTVGTLLLTTGKTTFHDPVSASGDVELTGGADLALEAPANSALGDVNIGNGSTLAGSLASAGETIILPGGKHELGIESTIATGSYTLGNGAELRMELSPDINGARLAFAGGISLESGSTVVLFAPMSFLPLPGSTYLLFASTSPMDLGGAQLVGEGALAGYQLSLADDGILTIAAIPEPNTIALAALAGLITFGVRLRRKI